ncbi:hypothetical protein [Mycolicibacterium fortuitum]|uniref:Uncharacterized protein n=2 Tax=Mycolicibacterium fortuitum TaxID=1766 RepID=A0AAE4VFP3_MYCFO|nr:hypothetical protein [Mycolicibacterium fortuitum]MCV7137657.1 hypothetical protein [Mycolicibacterium fortuitum]MDV7193326.1 hypothetical protein [Mycolicibacterium fortuitum]MDV7205993.1 hypothetical protein [Mycolicibacterium fortuitum]MDV7227406.1 hypothetical protein [Mycolicibacterium fortuitum]MDV7259897.1 hypothetical protein [Mycolicibacterium fortuitum]
MAPKGNHKSLAGSFGGAAPTPERGSKLQGLLNAASNRGLAAVPDTAQPDPNPAQPEAQPESPPQPTETAATPETANPTTETATRERRTKKAGTSAPPPASSVYLTHETYKRLQTTSRSKIKSYAQIVQDAFAGIAKEAEDTGKTPADVLKGLFQTPETDDPWLMPSSVSRAKSEAPLTEARISFSAAQRQWIENKMTMVNVNSFSEFVARILEHHLPVDKRRRRAAAK